MFMQYLSVNVCLPAGLDAFAHLIYASLRQVAGYFVCARCTLNNRNVCDTLVLHIARGGGGGHHVGYVFGSIFMRKVFV